MNPFAKRAEPLSPAYVGAEPLVLTDELVANTPSFDQEQWAESRAEQHGAGGRRVLGTVLGLLAVVWLAFSAWSAGRSLGGQSLASPAFAQWIAATATPLALLGLVWLMFGRTRRKEAERFTRSVVAMRTEAQSLEALLEVLSQRIQDSRIELTMISQHLMQLGDDATGKLGNITREFDTSTERLKRHGEALDRAAESARNDMAVLLEDLPRAEETARAVAEQLRSVGSKSGSKTTQLGQQVSALAERTMDADRLISEATDRLAVRLAEIDAAGTSAAARVGEAQTAFHGSLDLLLDRASTSLDNSIGHRCAGRGCCGAGRAVFRGHRQGGRRSI